MRADQARLLFALGFPLGALGHLWWVRKHGPLYHFERPAWAVWFWYGLSLADFGVAALLMKRPRPGLVAANATMAVSLYVNLLVFDSFRHGFNRIVAVLTVLGVSLAVLTPWMWGGSGRRR